MKRILFSVLSVAMVASAVNAQSIVSKKGENYLPEAGDYAIGFDAVPVFNILKFNDANAKIGAASVNNMYTFYGKKFESANEACRFGLTLGLNSNSQKIETDELDNGVASGDMVEDKAKQSNFMLNLSIGHEYRRGNTRLQGVWGYEGFAGISTSKDSYEFGNDNGDLADGTYTLETRSGTSFNVGLRGFIGAEYFVAPKLSVAVEYGLGLGLAYTGRGEQTTLDVTAGDADESTNDFGNKNTNFGINTDVTGGAVKVLFHF